MLITVRVKKITHFLDFGNKVDFSLKKEDGKLIEFAINYSARIKNKWYEVYRVDNFHGFLHEQKFWITKQPIPITEYDFMNLKDVFDMFFKKIKENCLRYRKYMGEMLFK